MRRYPLITRLTLALSLLALLAMASISSALLLSRQIEGDATAINLAGSLRMTAYRILAAEREPDAETSALATEEWRTDFQRRLTDQNMTAVIPNSGSHAISRAYQDVLAAWQRSPLSDSARITSTQAADEMVATIDHLVLTLERTSEQKLALLRLAGWGFASTAVILVLGIGIWFRRAVVRPLRLLSEQAEALGAQHWETRSGLTQPDELGNLSQQLDSMAAALAISYADMQEQIDARTRHLANAQSRAALLNERAAIARELHDSLAQSLTYQKIQLTLLNSSLSQRQIDTEVWQPTLKNLRENINESYRQLRELLVTFRLPLNHGGLDAALKSTLEELSRQGTVRFNLSGDFSTISLTANQEVNVLHIIREALVNVIRHSGADQADVRIVHSDRQVMVEVLDNGVGLRQPDDPERPRSQHFGLQMLQERAQQLHGTLVVKHREDKPGTAVILVFPVKLNTDAKESKLS